MVGPGVLLDERVRQPDGRAVYDLLTGHPDRASGDLVFLADLAVELRAWQGTDWTTQGIDVDGVAEAIVQLARRGQVRARWYHELTAWDAKALGRPAMDYARGELRDRLSGWLAEQYMRWLHPTSGLRPSDEPFLELSSLVVARPPSDQRRSSGDQARPSSRTVGPDRLSDRGHPLGLLEGGSGHLMVDATVVRGQATTRSKVAARFVSGWSQATMSDQRSSTVVASGHPERTPHPPWTPAWPGDGREQTAKGYLSGRVDRTDGWAPGCPAGRTPGALLTMLPLALAVAYVWWLAVRNSGQAEDQAKQEDA